MQIRTVCGRSARVVPGLAGLSVGDVAQLGEHCLCKAGVAGSTPVVSTGESVLGRL